MDNLDEILNGSSDESAPQPEVASTPAPEAEGTVEGAEVSAQPEAPAEGRTRVPKGEPGAGRFVGSEEAPKGDTTADERPASEEESKSVPVAALTGERTRRQAAEERERAKDAELAQLRAEIQQFRQPQAIPQRPAEAQAPVEEEEPNRWDDPEGWERWVVQTASARAAETARAEAVNVYQQQRLASSADVLRAQLPDYGEKIAAFGQMLQRNPALLQELHRAPDPAKFAYDTAKTQLEINQYGGLEGLIAARVEAALQAQAAPTLQAEVPPPIPPSLAGSQSVRGSVPLGPPSLEQLLQE